MSRAFRAHHANHAGLPLRFARIHHEVLEVCVLQLFTVIISQRRRITAIHRKRVPNEDQESNLEIQQGAHDGI